MFIRNKLEKFLIGVSSIFTVMIVAMVLKVQQDKKTMIDLEDNLAAEQSAQTENLFPIEETSSLPASGVSNEAVATPNNNTVPAASTAEVKTAPKPETPAIPAQTAKSSSNKKTKSS